MGKFSKVLKKMNKDMEDGEYPGFILDKKTNKYFRNN
jgi:hypothetical protein